MPARQPNVLKFRKGTLRKSRLNPRAPSLPVQAPPMPRGLTPRARRAWRELIPLLERMEVVTAVDGPPVRLLADVFAEYAEADAEVRRCGLTYETTTESGSVMVRTHPAVLIRADAHRRMVALCRDYGLTPASRDKVSRATGEHNDPGAHYFED